VPHVAEPVIVKIVEARVGQVRVEAAKVREVERMDVTIVMDRAQEALPIIKGAI
jgi:hypothetical protein